MSKVLKFIVNLVVLLSIVVAAALLVPPLLGVDTVINDNSNIETNLPVGTVAYGKQIDVKELDKKDKIIYMEGSAQYVYEIQDMDTTAGAYTVKDVYNKNSDTESIMLQEKVSKEVIAIPLIGYAAIALQSKTGLMVVGAVIVLLIILFVLSEVLRRGDDEEDEEDEEEYEEDDEDDEEDDEPGYWERRRLKKEEKRRQKEAEYEDEEEDEDDEEDDEPELSAKERRRLKKEEKRRRKLAKKGLLEEDEEEDEIEEPQEMFQPENTPSETVQEIQGFDEAMKDAMSSIAFGVAQVSEPENVPDATMVMPDAEELEKAVQEAEIEEEEEIDASENSVADDTGDTIIIEETEPEEIEMEEVEEPPVNADAVPKTPSVEELLAKAAAIGEQPEVKKDEENDVTLLDYSDLL